MSLSKEMLGVRPCMYIIVYYTKIVNLDYSGFTWRRSNSSYRLIIGA
jgi:hypothetical protein